jgi:hypothetical protein
MEEIDPGQLWRYISLSEYAPPQATMSRSIKGGLKGLWQKFQKPGKIFEDPEKSESDLEPIPDTLMEQIAPGPDWRLPAGVLKNALDERIKRDTTENAIFLVVGLPHGGNTEILTALAESLKYPVIEAPSAGQILSQDHSWLKQIKTMETPWILPALERCYLRHVCGLALVRQLFERINAGEIRNGIIGCDSWALAYLKHVLPGRLPGAMVAQAFDDHGLSRWFNQLAASRFQKPVVFCQTDNGEPVLPMEPEHGDDPSMADNAVGESSAFMNQLAAHSFGIPGIALSIWKTALKKEPEKTMADKLGVDTPADMKSTIWVLPWDKLVQPVIPSEINPEASILLHSLLLHNGLSQAMLEEILPFSANGVTRMAMVLKDTGLMVEHDGLWQVSPWGYPVVRRYLDGEGYLTDRF